MMSQKRIFDPMQPPELSQLIDQYHDQFLDTDISEKKLDILGTLRGYVTQYLHLVQHHQKFQFKETSRILENSVTTRNGFDPRDASAAFECLAKYSHNLMEQPWRKEFHKIKMTSGYYMHNINSHLANAHELLLLLDYIRLDDTTVEIRRMPEMKKLKAFSRDCFIASQECLILSHIWERFQQQVPDYPFTVQDTFMARKELVGDSETILHSLRYKYEKWKHNQEELQLQEDRRQFEARRLQDIQRQEERLLRERERKEAQMEIDEQRQADEHLAMRLTRTELAKKPHFEKDPPSHSVYSRNYVPVDQLIDYADEKQPEERDLVQHVLNNTEKFGTTEYRDQYEYTTKIHVPYHTPTNLTNGGGSTSNNALKLQDLKELQDVAMDIHLHRNTYSDEVDLGSKRNHTDETLRTFEEKSKKVEEVQIRRSISRSQATTIGSQAQADMPSNSSAFAPYHTSSSHQQNGFSNGSSSHEANSGSNENFGSRYSPNYVGASGGFKALKQRQDFPKGTSSSSSSWRLVSNPTNLSPSNLPVKVEVPGRRIGLEPEREYKPRTTTAGSHVAQSALTKSKVPHDSSSSAAEEFEPSASSSSLSPFEIGTDLLSVTSGHHSNYNYKADLPRVDAAGLAKKESPTTATNKIDKWTCQHCTFINKKLEFVCEICSKSKNLVVSEPSDSGEEVNPTPTASQTYASIAKKFKNLTPSPSPPTLKLNTEDIPKDLATYPPLQSLSSPPISSLSIEKFRKGLVRDENSNTNEEVWTCQQCTFKNIFERTKCEMCDEKWSPDPDGDLR